MNNTLSNELREFVFPLAVAKRVGNNLELEQVIGSAFLLGNRGFSLTARHVLECHRIQDVVGMFCSEKDGWRGFGLVSHEFHAIEDVAVFQLPPGHWNSIFRISGDPVHSAFRYHLLGYPDDTTLELNNGHQVNVRPDLVYNSGYVRRRFTGSIPQLIGRSFLELSEVAGSGVSGSPVFKIAPNDYGVVGIYVGEKLNERSTSVGYAVRAESFSNWVPTLLGNSVQEEGLRIGHQI